MIALLATSLPAGAGATDTRWIPVTPALVRPEATTTVYLADVAATSPVDVWAVGNGWGDGPQPVIAHWDGGGWRHLPAPNVADFEYTLAAVDAVSPHDAWAVGSGHALPPGWDSITMTAVIAHYDGTVWSVSPTPAPPPGYSYILTNIDMLSATDGWAVGWKAAFGGPTSWQPLVMRWQDRRWVEVGLPSLPGGDVMLQGVQARAGDDAWAVGHQGNSALVMHFDGTSWNQIGVPRGGVDGAGNDLRAVAAVSARDVWAVGAACGSASDPEDLSCRPLVLHLSHGRWRVVATAGDSGTHIVDVAVRSTNDVWLIGYDNGSVGGQDANHVERWHGRGFTTVPADPGPSACPCVQLSELASALEAVTVIPGSRELWAVGWQGRDAQGSDAQVIRHR